MPIAGLTGQFGVLRYSFEFLVENWGEHYLNCIEVYFNSTTVAPLPPSLGDAG